MNLAGSAPPGPRLPAEGDPGARELLLPWARFGLMLLPSMAIRLGGWPELSGAPLDWVAAAEAAASLASFSFFFLEDSLRLKLNRKLWIDGRVLSRKKLFRNSSFLLLMLILW